MRPYLLPWTIQHCDARTYDGMGWVDRQEGIFFLDWTRQGNTGWVPSDAARAWSTMKGHLKKKKPRDLKAGLRNAYRSKKNELVKIKISKKDSERDGRKRVLWKFLNLERELEKIFNPATKGNQNKKSVTKKSQQELEELIKENSTDSNNSLSFDFEVRSLNLKGSDAKGKPSKKRGRPPKKQLEVTPEPLPPVQLLMSRRNFGGDVDSAYQPPLQSQVISSTISKNHLREKYKNLASFFDQDFFSHICGPTPPPQATDVVFEDSRERFCTPVSSPRSENSSIYSFPRDSPNVDRSDESRQSPTSSSPFFPLWNEAIKKGSSNVSDESRQLPTSSSLFFPLENETISDGSSNRSDESRQLPTSSSLFFPLENETISDGSSNRSDESMQLPTSSSPFFPLWNEAINKGSSNLSDESRQSPTSSSPFFTLWNETIPNDLHNIQVILSYDLNSTHSTSTLRPQLQPHQSEEIYENAHQDRCPSPNQLQGCALEGQALGPNEAVLLSDSLQFVPLLGIPLDQTQPSVSENQSMFPEMSFLEILSFPDNAMNFNQ